MATYYTEDHEWVSVDGDKGKVGITAYAAEQLGDVVFVETPDVGKIVKKGDDMAVVEFHTKHGIGQGVDHRAIHLDLLFFRHEFHWVVTKRAAFCPSP